MSRMDLIGVNAKIVRSVVEQVVKHAPDAVLIVVSNPLDEMTALAAKVSAIPRAPGDRPGRDARHGQVQLLRGRATRRAGRRRGDADARIARRHDGAGPVGVLGQRHAAGRPAQRRRDRRAGGSHQERRRARSSACSRPDPLTTRPRQRRLAWSGRSPRTAAPSCRCAPGWTASTASPASTWAWRPRSARDGIRRVVERELTDDRTGRTARGRRGGPRQAGRRSLALGTVAPARPAPPNSFLRRKFCAGSLPSSPRPVTAIRGHPACQQHRCLSGAAGATPWRQRCGRPGLAGGG